MKLLSILIPSLEVRSDQLNKMLFTLEDQIASANLNDRVEVVTFVDNFENTIGKKRNRLLEESTGKFTCFIDDDDVIHNKYCSLMVDAIEKNDDIQQIGFKVRVFINGRERNNAYHSLKYKGWYQNGSGYYRQTATLNPMLSSITKSVKFQEISLYEDQKWVEEIIKTGLLKKEYYIDDYLYLYYFNEGTSLSGHRKDKNVSRQSINWRKKDISRIEWTNIS